MAYKQVSGSMVFQGQQIITAASYPITRLATAAWNNAPASFYVVFQDIGGIKSQSMTYAATPLFTLGTLAVVNASLTSAGSFGRLAVNVDNFGSLVAVYDTGGNATTRAMKATGVSFGGTVGDFVSFVHVHASPMSRPFVAPNGRMYVATSVDRGVATGLGSD